MAKNDMPDYMRGFDTTDDWGFVPVSSKPVDHKPGVDEEQLDSKFEDSVFDFDISDSLMKRLDDLDERYVTCWDPHNPPDYAPV